MPELRARFAERHCRIDAHQPDVGHAARQPRRLRAQQAIHHDRIVRIEDRQSLLQHLDRRGHPLIHADVEYLICQRLAEEQRESARCPEVAKVDRLGFLAREVGDIQLRIRPPRDPPVRLPARVRWIVHVALLVLQHNLHRVVKSRHQHGPPACISISAGLQAAAPPDAFTSIATVAQASAPLEVIVITLLPPEVVSY